MIMFFVTERLAFGSKATQAQDVKKLRSKGITHIIDLRRHRVRELRVFKTLWLGAADNGRPRPQRFFREALTFYRKAMSRPESKIFVMCKSGRRRSASMTYFLLRASGIGVRKAGATIHGARPTAQIVGAYRESGEKYLKRRQNL
jgi:protein tyrosine phosphatase (PTP) superfamily phosphohydrolase (DUF442 family)